MKQTRLIAREITRIMPKIARMILFDFFQTFDIPQTQLFAIIVLREHGSCRFSVLSGALHISPPTATGIIDRLERAGYVKRVHDQDDRRAVNVSLTRKGLALAKRFSSILEKKWALILSKLSPKDSREYLRILKIIQASMHS